MIKKPVGIIRFLGTNCDRDIWSAVEAVGGKPSWIWHEDRFDAAAYSGLVVPGGFSYGDYLRAGALAARSRVMKGIAEAGKKGIPIIGICNGFQILCESNLLPGALVQNSGQRFIDKWVGLKLERTNKFWASGYSQGREISLPIAHGEGRFYAPEDELKRIEDQGQVWWRYAQNPNGALNDIAGVTNVEGNIAALMPHPERALFTWMQGTDGLAFFSSLMA